MEFKRVLFLKKQMAHKIGKESPVLCEQEVFSMDALTLAYIGDACWSFFIRKALIDTGMKVAKRARNTSSHVPKSATVEEYRESTAFEALLGYLYLSGQKQRLDFILEKSLKYVAGEMSHEN